MTPYVAREAASSIDHALRSLPVVVVTGMRQTGKTTLLCQDPSLAKRRFASLDDLASFDTARRDPEGFVAGDEPLTIDEAQRCPELLVAVKREVDRRRRPGRFLLSGSANFGLLKGMSESLAGRAIYLPLLPFARREIRQATGLRPALVPLLEEGAPRSQTEASPSIRLDEVLMGGMPPVCLGQEPDARLWFRGFEQTYLERDLRALSQVADLAAFRRVLRLAALRTGQVLNQSELGRDAGLNSVTTARYLSLLETSFLIHRLPPFLGNRASRIIHAPKLYFADSGLAAHLAGLPLADLDHGDLLAGPLLETYVHHNLLAILSAHLPDARLSFWNVQGRHEVDFVVEMGRACAAIEVKIAARWQARDLAGLEAFLRCTPRCRVAILAYGGRATVSLGDRLWAIPIAELLS